MIRISSSAAHSGFTLRVLCAALLVCAGLSLGLLSFAAAPPAGSIGVASSPVTWTGTATGTGAANGESTCVEGTNCDTFTLTITGLPSDWSTAGKRVEVRVSPPNSYDDYDLVIHKGSNSGPIVDNSGNGPGVAEVAHINPATDGIGVYTVHVVYFATVPPDQYRASAAVVPLTPTAPPPATLDNGPAIGYENFDPPAVLTPVTTSTGPGIEYLGRNAIEPSIGVNQLTDVTNFQSDLETLFITFNNGCTPGQPASTWVNRPAPTSQVIDSDPIGFTDLATGRVFAAELSATSPNCKVSYSDNDGQTWIATSGPLGSGIDHQTIGGGPYHAPIPGTPAFPRAFYYCSQDLVAAFCLRSDNGGQTWGPAVPTYTTECGGLHGHVKVSETDGTVYLPNKDCSGTEAAVVSEDNGNTWNIRPVANGTTQTAPSESDPAVAIDAGGRVYFAAAHNDSSAVIATSDDRGQTWQNIINVSSAFGLQNIRYPAATAGDAGRAAIAFLGSTTAGSANAGSFLGSWHLYVAHTFNGGQTWSVSDVTPNAPMQRGCIWTGGGANICRNLADFFDISFDKEGRVQVGYPNGCPGGDCAQAAPSATGNGYAAVATIARQSSGRRLRAAYDPSTSTQAPGMPTATARRLGGVVHLAWSLADTGNSPITQYQILRSTAAGSESILATVPGTQLAYDDIAAFDSSKTYFYKVVAVNAVGASCPNNEISAPPRGDTCSGVIVHQNDPSHPEAPAVVATPQLAIDYVAVAEPAGSNNFLFKMKVTNLSTIPPNSRWRMVWDSFASPGQQFYVGMRSDSNSVVTFDYGTIATAVVGLVLGVPTETTIAPALPQSNYNVDGTISVYVPKSAVGNPQPGDLLGAFNGRTFTGDTSQTGNLERSTALIDHTFVKAQTDNAYPPATYTVQGNAVCATPVPVSAVSRKTHGNSGTFDVPLPLTGAPGIEPRSGGSNGDFQVVVTFSGPVTLTGSPAAAATTGSGIVTSVSVNGSTVTVNLTGVGNAQYVGITLNGVTVAGNTGNVTVPMAVLLGDSNGDGAVNSGDSQETRNRSGQLANSSNFRSDVNVDGAINSGDAILVRQASGTGVNMSGASVSMADKRAQ